MKKVKGQDLFAGVKAEQSLRDAVRAVIDSDLSDEGLGDEGLSNKNLELVPFRRKDWIAGVRLDSGLSFSAISLKCQKILTMLLKLDSRQRIRSESIKLYVVPPPVPVFKNPIDNDLTESPSSPLTPDSVDKGARNCPVCNRIVHSYNLHYNPKGVVVGCFMCGNN